MQPIRMVRTLEDIEDLDSEMLTAQQIAPILCANPETIRLQARERPELLGFPVIVMGNRVKIPRQPFLSFMRGTGEYFNRGVTNKCL